MREKIVKIKTINKDASKMKDVLKWAVEINSRLYQYDEKGVLWFYSTYGEKRPVKLVYEKFEFDENQCEQLIELVIRSPEKIREKNFSSEPMGIFMNEEYAVDKLKNFILNKWTYISENEEKDIIDFISDFFALIINSHFLTNGNKRLGTAVLISLLKNCGFYPKFSEEDWFINYYVENYEKPIIGFVEKLENKSEEDNCNKYKEKTLNEIRQWILSILYLSV